MDTTERRLLDDVQAEPKAREPRDVYADWLEARGDVRAQFLRCDAALWSLDPDHVLWTEAEHELSQLRVAIDPGWIAEVETPATPPAYHSPDESWCPCSPATRYDPELEPPQLHRQVQDTESSGWQRLLELIDEAAADERDVFEPRKDLSDEQWAEIITLPKSIAKLVRVVELRLYGSCLVRIPPEIGAMAQLHDFDPYTSYALHWYPYELLHAGQRKNGPRDIRQSTRTIYGNDKSRLGTPPIGKRRQLDRYWDGRSLERPCSICGTQFHDLGHHRVWYGSLLVHACSNECVARLRRPHLGGPAGKETPWVPS